jgi:APA family basic amino acid/polyamine antiporter
VAGSAYTFSYATLGELIAWIIGWDLILELMLGASVVAQGWSTYFVKFLDEIGVTWPASIGPSESTSFEWNHLNVPALLLVALLTTLVALGIKESMRVNLVLVALKLFIVLFVIVAGLFYVSGANYDPFIPPAADPVESPFWTQPLIQWAVGIQPQTFGVLGVISAASVVFFAYIGFDVVATTAEEARNPQKDLPKGILGSLAICTVLYVAVALVITGMVPYDKIDPDAALASAFTSVGQDGFATMIAAGAVAGLTTVVMTLLIGAIRVLFAMSRDGLIPHGFGRTNPRTGTPLRITVTIGATVAVVAAYTPIGKLEEMVNIGTLTAFALVSLAVPVLRKSRPDLDRPFRVPLSPWLPILSALVCLYLMVNLSIETWLRFVVWMVLGFVIYFGYSHRNSRVRREEKAAA